MENNNQQIHHRDGAEFARISAKHKKFVERDFPAALTQFRIAFLKQQIIIEESLEILRKESDRITKIQNITKSKVTDSQTQIKTAMSNEDWLEKDYRDRHPSPRDVYGD